MKYTVTIKEKPISKEDMNIKIKEFQEAFSEAVVRSYLDDLKKKT